MTEIEIDVETGEVEALPVTTVNLIPPEGLQVAAQVGGGTFAAGNYFWVVTATNAFGETTASNEVTVAVALNGSAVLTWEANAPGTVHVRVYRGVAAGAENALIATLGNVLTFTDTGTAGSAGNPPVSNTAEQADYQVIQGSGKLMGWSLRNTSGSVICLMELQDAGRPLGESHLVANGNETVWFGNKGVRFRGQISLHMIQGNLTGCIYAEFDAP